MNAEIKNDLASMLTSKLSALIKEYGLKVVRVDATEALLVGSSYALQFSADRDGLEVIYIERDCYGQLTAYTLRPLVMQRFTQEDRMGYGSPITIKERLLASVSVYASGLENRCKDVLMGEKSWLKRDSWNSGNLSPITQKFLENELQM
jgi:hypothetical protein